MVKVNLENFSDAAIFQHNLKRNTERSFKKMQEMRKITNHFISDLLFEFN
ncbi:MAG: hypothetical protein J7L95_00995 [Prolixibacteraceae bacterium]|nr:hypothetical protein [Prolixibacteraceae bacterium]